MTRSCRAVVALATMLFVFATAARAGGGPETTLVVVNANSPVSLAIANEFVRLREVPATHVLYMEDVPTAPVITVDTFREKILKPIEAHLEAKGLSDLVDTVAYSAGFPYGVNFQPDVAAKKPKLTPLVRPTASLTGLTYLYRRVLAEDPEGYLGQSVNGYFRRPAGLEAPAGGRGQRPQMTPQERRKHVDAQGAIRSKDYQRAATLFAELTAAHPEKFPYWYDFACCLAILDRKAEALDALEKAVENGWSRVDHTLKDPDLESLRDEPAFQRLIEAMQGGQPAEAAVDTGVQPSHGFSARLAWTGEDAPEEPTEDNAADRFRMAVMLGWTGAHGNTMDEVLDCLRSAASSDGTRPDGTVYLMVNKDKARIQPRQVFYPGVIEGLRRLGRKTEVVDAATEGEDGILPTGRDDVIGLVTGKASITWGKDRPNLLPGAIADHLTSFGAHFGTPGQTKCTLFVRHGAAGTSGTVAEPLNAFVKFPIPHVHLHYARGCSMAEAHYQSVWMPYQLLILGDPLARPFATFARVSVTSPDPAAPWSGTVEVRADVGAEPGHGPAALELWVDGVRVAEGAPTSALTWDTTTVADGWHDVRVVAVEIGSVQTRSFARHDVRVANGTLEFEVEAPEGAVAIGDALTLSGKAPGVAAVELRRGDQVLASAPCKGTSWELALPSHRLGPGTTRLQVAAKTAEGEVFLSRPLDVVVELVTTRQLPVVVSESELLPGLRGHVQDAEGVVREAALGSLGRDVGRGSGRTLKHDLETLGAPNPQHLRLEGLFGAQASGTYQLELHAAGPVTVRIGDKDVFAFEAAPPGGSAFTWVGLEEGRHPIFVEVQGEMVNEFGLSAAGPSQSGAVRGDVLAHLPPETDPSKPPESATAVNAPRGLPALLDGKREGGGHDVVAEGVEVHWGRTQRSLVGVVLFPARARVQGEFPATWVVETRTSTRGRWKPVKKQTVLLGAPTEAPRKDAVFPPSFVYVSFSKVSARQVRIRPTDADARVTEVRALVYKKKRR